MKAVFVSETADHIVLTLDVTKSELVACAEGNEATAKALTEAVLAACRMGRFLPEPARHVPIKEVACPPEYRSPFRVEHYKGVQIQRAMEGRNGLSPEEFMKEQLLDSIIARNVIYIPDEQITREVEYEFIGRAQALKYQCMMSGDYSRYYNYGTQEDREAVERNIIRQIKVDKILESVIAQEQITATPEELEDRAKDIARRQDVSYDMIKQFFGKDFALLTEELIKEKALDFIYQNAIITE